MPILLALPPPDPGFEFVLASQGMSQGVLQTEGVQIIPRAFVRFGDVQIGGQWRNISSPSADGVAAMFVKVSRKLANGQLDAGVFYRIRTGAKGTTAPRAWEFSVGARRSFGRLGLRVSAEYGPRDFTSGKSLYVELGPTFDIDKLTRISASIGRREREFGPDYTSLNAGIGRVVERRLTLDARYYHTDRSDLGSRFRGRIIVSARLAL